MRRYEICCVYGRSGRCSHTLSFTIWGRRSRQGRGASACADLSLFALFGMKAKWTGKPGENASPGFMC